MGETTGTELLLVTPCIETAVLFMVEQWGGSSRLVGGEGTDFKGRELSNVPEHADKRLVDDQGLALAIDI